MNKMSEKLYLCLFILCAIFAQEIVGTQEDDLRDSENPLIRQKRVINRLPGQDVPYPSAVSTHTVNIKEWNHIHCIGTILSLKTVITAARCIAANLSVYTVFAGSTYSNRGSIHNVTEKRIRRNHPVRGQTFETGVALIYVDPPFRPRRGNIVSIGLHEGLLVPGMVGMVRGWGTCYLGGPSESQYGSRLRAIQVPIVNHENCVNRFREFFQITDSYFCTSDFFQQCAHKDIGAGFIIENSLAGIYLGPIYTGVDSHMEPDVFIMVQHPDYNHWIFSNIEH